MKNKNNKTIIMLIISILIFLITFLEGWYKYFLVDSIFFISILLHMTIILINVLFLTFTINSYKKNKSKLALASLIIIILSLVVRIIFPFDTVKTNIELILYEDERSKIVEMIKNNELKPDKLNNVELPKQYKKYSNSGEVHIEKNDEEGQIIDFWIFRGLLSGSKNLIYTSKDEKFIKENVDDIESIKKLKDNWYYVIIE